MSSTLQSSTLITPIAVQSMNSEDEYSIMPDSNVSPTLGILTQSNMLHQTTLNSAFQPRNSKFSIDKNFHENKISEALFVKLLITKCKRIAPLWFRGVSSMREKNRGEHKKVSSTFGNNQNEWVNIVGKINEMTASDEGDAVVNLLRKLYKELPMEAVYWFLHCWLNSEESCSATNECVISRGDAKGRMRRIDCGKGSDKVWRLDTVVGMLYHGLPMSSTDTSMMIHTCDEELCVRPQHLRFRATSVALVVVLKALTQAGYTIISPDKNKSKQQHGKESIIDQNNPNNNAATIDKIKDDKNDDHSNRPFNRATHEGIPQGQDEHVDVYGPFTIEQVEQYRIENVQPTGSSYNKLSLSSTDYEMIETVPLFKTSLSSVEEMLTNNNNFHHSNDTFRSHSLNAKGRNSHGVSPTSTASYSSTCSNLPSRGFLCQGQVGSQNSENVFFPANQNDNVQYTLNGTPAYTDIYGWPLSKEAQQGQKTNPIATCKSAFLSKDGQENARKSLKRKHEEDAKVATRDEDGIPGMLIGESQWAPRQPAKKRPEARTPTTSTTIVELNSNSDNNNILMMSLTNAEDQSRQHIIQSEYTFIDSSNSAYQMVQQKQSLSNTYENGENKCHDLGQHGHVQMTSAGPYDEEEEELAGIAASKNHELVKLFCSALENGENSKKLNENRQVSSTCSSNGSSAAALLPLLGSSPSILDDDRSPPIKGKRNLIKKSPEFPDFKLFQTSDGNNNNYSQIVDSSDRTRLIKLLRNSPQYQTNPELIEILINISQQYGPKKVPPRCLSSSGIQSVFYDKVFNSSLSSSPVQLTSTGRTSSRNNNSSGHVYAEEYPVLSRSPTQQHEDPEMGHSQVSHYKSKQVLRSRNGNSLHQADMESTSRIRTRPSSTNIRASLRQLSFTPLSVDIQEENIQTFRPIQANAKSLSSPISK